MRDGVTEVVVRLLFHDNVQLFYDTLESQQHIKGDTVTAWEPLPQPLFSLSNWAKQVIAEARNLY